jgi:hypothetical protein
VIYFKKIQFFRITTEKLILPKIEETNMKKLYVGLVFGIFAMASFMALNLYTSTSFPGFASDKECNYCHNQPALVKNVDASFALNDHAAASAAFSNSQWAMDEVPIIQTNNRSDANLEFSSITFLKNSTDIMVRLSVGDNTFNNTSSATSDKFGLIFNIDVVNFTVGQFLTSYDKDTTDLNAVLSGQMAFTNGHADFWYVDMAKTPVNTSTMAQDEAISTGIIGDGASNQNVHVAVFYGAYGHGNSMEYDIFFVRSLSTSDSNDAQFNVDGTAIHYAIAVWQASAATFHHSSFDQMIIVGNEFNVIHTETSVQTTEVTKTVTGTSSTSGTTSSFTAIFVLAGLAVSIPLISHMRKRK